MSGMDEATMTLADQLRRMYWPQVRLHDFRFADICPACSSLVAAGEGADRSHREQHILSLHSD